MEQDEASEATEHSVIGIYISCLRHLIINVCIKCQDEIFSTQDQDQDHK